MIDLADLMARLNKAMEEAKQAPSPYAKEFRKEQEVLPAVSGLPMVIRAFLG